MMDAARVCPTAPACSHESWFQRILLDGWTDDGYVAELATCMERALSVTPADLPFVEVGSRRGGTALLALHLFGRAGQRGRWLFTVDPFGAMPYPGGPYSDELYRDFMAEVSLLCREERLNHHHFRQTSKAWLGHTLPTWRWFDCGRERAIDRIAFAYLDGDHRQEFVEAELRGLWPRLVEGGMIVVDNADGMGWLPDIVATLPDVRERAMMTTKYVVVK